MIDWLDRHTVAWSFEMTQDDPNFRPRTLYIVRASGVSGEHQAKGVHLDTVLELLIAYLREDEQQLLVMKA